MSPSDQYAACNTGRNEADAYTIHHRPLPVQSDRCGTKDVDTATPETRFRGLGFRGLGFSGLVVWDTRFKV